MAQDLFTQSYYTNTLLDDGFIKQKAGELRAKPIPYDLPAWLMQNFDAAKLAVRNEAQLEEKFIGPLLAQLGWAKAYQVGLTVQGKFAKPDYCLLSQPEFETTLITSRDHSVVTAICESKAWDKTLDTGKADRENNPHHQLQDYLSTLRVRFGFLTNGRIWRVYDTDKITAKKTFIEFDLERLWHSMMQTKKLKALACSLSFLAATLTCSPEKQARPAP